jgi:hypothetical protein
MAECLFLCVVIGAKGPVHTRYLYSVQKRLKCRAKNVAFRRNFREAQTFPECMCVQAFSQVTVLGVCAQSVYTNLVFYCEGAGRGRFYRKITWKMKCR